MISGEEMLVNSTSKPTLPPPKPPRARHQLNIEPKATDHKDSINAVKIENYYREFLNFGRQMKRQIETGWNNNVRSTSPRDTLFSMTNHEPITTEVPPKQTLREKEDGEEQIKPERSHNKVEQVTTFILADDKRNADFHQLFKSVPEDDHLIQEYNCAYYRDIMIQGRLFISQHYLCFNSRFFNWVTNVIISFSDIVALDKKTMALVVPNGIQLTTETGKYVFASFMARDVAFKQIKDIWKHSKLVIPEEKKSIEKEHLKEEISALLIEKRMLVYPSTMIALDMIFYGSLERLNDVLYKNDTIFKRFLYDKIRFTNISFSEWKNGSRENTYYNHKEKVTVFDSYKIHNRDEIIVSSLASFEPSSYSFLSHTKMTNESKGVRLLITFRTETPKELDNKGLSTLLHYIRLHFTYYEALGKELQKICLMKDTILTTLEQKIRQLKQPKCQRKKINNSNVVTLLVFLFALMIHFLIISKFIFEISDRIQQEQKYSDDYFLERMQEMRARLWELSQDTMSQRENMLNSI